MFGLGRRTEASTVGIAADKARITVLAVFNVVLSRGSELSMRTRLARVGFSVVLLSRGVLLARATARKRMASVGAICLSITSSY